MDGDPTPQTYEARILTKNREERYLELSITGLEFEGKEATLGQSGT